MPNDKTVYLFVVITLLVLVGYGQKQGPATDVIDTSPQFREYLLPEADFDFSPSILQIALRLKDGANTNTDKIRTTARFVASSIAYDSSVDVQYCYDETATTVLNSQKGDCVSMTRLNVALLRAQGVPARSVGGCITFRESCAALYSIIEQRQIPKPASFNESDFKKRGYLHEWVEAWDGTQWVLVEATTGEVFPTDCISYTQFGYDSNQYNRCVISNKDFVGECRTK